MPIDRSKSKKPIRSYTLTGFVLCSVGAFLIFYGTIAGIAYIQAFGIAAVIVGVTSLTLPEQVTASRAMGALFQSSTMSTECILSKVISELSLLGVTIRKIPKSGLILTPTEDEVGLESSAVYLPPRQDDKLSLVYLPVKPNSTPQLEAMEKALLAFSAGTVLNATKSEPSQAGVLIYPVGSKIGDELDKDTDLENALSEILVNSTELCSGLNVSEVGDLILLELDNVRITTEAKIYSEILGSIAASLAGSIIAAVQNSPSVILDERKIENRTLIRFKILSKEKPASDRRTEKSPYLQSRPKDAKIEA